MQKLRVLDLFSGLGGFSLGLERTGGFETVAFCEIEPFPRSILRRHWPEVPIYDDVRELSATRLKADGIAVDVITAGFPCQDVSLAKHVHGTRDGLNGTWSGLYAEAMRLTEELGPAIVIFENVRALLSDGLGRVLQDLCAIGYDAEWHCIPATAVGSPQQRDRVWVIAYPAGQRVEGLFEGGSFGPPRQGRACGPEDLPGIFAAPLQPGRWPQPLICRGDSRPPDWVDRIKALGNAVDPAVPEVIGDAVLSRLRQAG